MSQTLEAVREFSSAAHEGQMYGDKPYIYHPEQVVEVLVRFGFNSEALKCAGLLHDTVEDTSVTLAQIEEHFGTEVAYLVEGVTNEPGNSRAERLEKTYPKIKEHNDRITLKLADRIANVEFSIETNSDLFDMYKSEYKKFREHLFKFGPHLGMWRHLDFLLDYDNSQEYSFDNKEGLQTTNIIEAALQEMSGSNNGKSKET